MKRILGITAEYDPFHRGHAYQISRARELADPEAVICAMSGDFTQRGEPAILDKWARASIAARQGVDLVMELPFMYACSRADRFAAGAVDMLVSAGVTHISFGCEAERPEDLQKLAIAQLSEAEQVEERIRDLMRDGCSRAKALELASRSLFGDALTDLMLAPNNILALEYLKRIRQWESCGVQITPVPIHREGSGYKAADSASGFAGGAAIRKMIASGQDVTEYLPYDLRDFDDLCDADHPRDTHGISWNDLPAARQRLYEQVRGIILRSSPEQLARIYGVGEGMEHRMKKIARVQDSYDDFLSDMISRRYSAATIQRIMVYLLMNVEEMPDMAVGAAPSRVSSAAQSGVSGAAPDTVMNIPPYGRVLAASEVGRKLLRQIVDAAEDESADDRLTADGRRTVPPLNVIANSNRTEHLQPTQLESLQLDLRAADLYNLILGRDVDACSDARQRPWMGRK